MADVLGKVKSVPQTPGMLVVPNSAPETLAPNHWRPDVDEFPEDAAGILAADDADVEAWIGMTVAVERAISTEDEAAVLLGVSDTCSELGATLLELSTTKVLVAGIVDWMWVGSIVAVTC